MNPSNNESSLQDRIIAAAKRTAEERGWTWEEPVEVSPRLHNGESAWDVQSNAEGLGAKVRVILRQSDLALLHAGFLER